MLAGLSTKIPVFLHIPKNSGVYCSACFISLFKRFITNNKLKKNAKHAPSNGENYHRIHRVHVRHNNKTLMTIFLFDSDFFCNSNNAFKSHPSRADIKIIELESLDKMYNQFDQALKIFAIVIRAGGFSFIDSGLYRMFEASMNVKFIYFTFLRDVFSRQQSLYNYLTSQDSAHEITHGHILSKSLQEYLRSAECEDSWLIRELCNVGLTSSITDADYNRACEILDGVIIGRFDKPGDTIDSIFSECYNLTLKDINFPVGSERHSTQYNKRIVQSELDNETLEIFRERVKYDILLYDKYITANGI